MTESTTPGGDAREHVWPFVDEMQRAYQAELYYLTLMAALALPDIGAALSDPKGVTSKAKYVAWVEEWLGYEPASAVRLYKFRCSYLHEGSFIPHATAGVDPVRILIFEPGAGRVMVHGPQATIVYTPTGEQFSPLSLESFVREVSGATDKWLARYGQSNTVLSNLAKFVQRHPHGFGPFVGAPIFG